MNIGFIAHDARKSLMQNFCIAYKHILKNHTLYATGTTGSLIKMATNLDINILSDGHLGGAQQMATLIQQNQLDMLIFLRDPNAQEHEISIHRALMLCDSMSVPIATNLATAEVLIMALVNGDIVSRSQQH